MDLLAQAIQQLGRLGGGSIDFVSNVYGEMSRASGELFDSTSKFTSETFQHLSAVSRNASEEACHLSRDVWEAVEADFSANSFPQGVGLVVVAVAAVCVAWLLLCLIPKREQVILCAQLEIFLFW